MRREVFEAVGLTRCQVGEFNRDAVGNVAQPHMWEGDRNLVYRARPGSGARDCVGRRGRCSLQPERHAHVDAHVAGPGAAA